MINNSVKTNMTNIQERYGRSGKDKPSLISIVPVLGRRLINKPARDMIPAHRTQLLLKIGKSKINNKEGNSPRTLIINILPAKVFDFLI